MQSYASPTQIVNDKSFNLLLQARVSLESLLNLAPQTAVIAETGETVHVKDIMINAIVSVKAGELVPVDGAVVAGASTVDESSLTGEFMPVDKEIGSNVWSGTTVLTGLFPTSISRRTTQIYESYPFL